MAWSTPAFPVKCDTEVHAAPGAVRIEPDRVPVGSEGVVQATHRQEHVAEADVRNGRRL